MLNFTKTGEGNNKIVFLHGNSSSLSYWNTVIKSDLSLNHTLYNIDLPGHGLSFKSSEPSEDYSFKGTANHVLNFIESEVKDNFILIGHSLGCNIIGEFANRLKNCKGILLTSPSIIGENILINEISLPNETVGVLFKDTFDNDELSSYLNNVSINFDEEAKRKFIEDFKNTDGKVRTTILETIIKGDFSDQIESIVNLNIPYGIVFGEKDTICNIKYLDNLNLKLYKNHSIIVKNAGHYIQLDQPNELNEIIETFAIYCFN